MWLKIIVETLVRHGTKRVRAYARYDRLATRVTDCGNTKNQHRNNNFSHERQLYQFSTTGKYILCALWNGRASRLIFIPVVFCIKVGFAINQHAWLRTEINFNILDTSMVNIGRRQIRCDFSQATFKIIHKNSCLDTLRVHWCIPM